MTRRDLLAQAGNHVLHVGCGTIHGTALIASLCSSVVGIDEDRAFVGAAIANLWQLDISNAIGIGGIRESK
jgi:protein-L-isoaspartate O-methyltransferase